MWDPKKTNIIEIVAFILGILAVIIGLFSGNVVFTIFGAVLTVASSVLTFGMSQWEKAQEATKSQKFSVLNNPYQLGSSNDDLTSLCWTGKSLFCVGRVGGVDGLFKFNDEFKPSIISTPSDGWFWKVKFKENLFVIRIFEGSKFDILEFDENGKLLNLPINLDIEESEHPGCLIFADDHFWIGFDVVNRVYKFTKEFKIVDIFDTPHRILEATYADENLWITDAKNIYQYDLHFNFVDEYHYPGSSCRGLAFDNKNMWSIDNVRKRLLKHYF